jgi:hypothetical protein
VLREQFGGIGNGMDDNGALPERHQM